METKSKSSKIIRDGAPFILLFVPQLTWFQKLLNEKSVDPEQSLSSWLVELIVSDLSKKQMLTKENFNQFYLAQGKHKKSKRASKGVHRKFSLYLPPNLDFLKEKVHKASEKNHSMSTYIWNLVVVSRKRSIDSQNLKEWEEYFANQQRGTPIRKAA